MSSHLRHMTLYSYLVPSRAVQYSTVCAHMPSVSCSSRARLYPPGKSCGSRDCETARLDKPGVFQLFQPPELIHIRAADGRPPLVSMDHVHSLGFRSCHMLPRPARMHHHRPCIDGRDSRPGCGDMLLAITTRAHAPGRRILCTSHQNCAGAAGLPRIATNYRFCVALLSWPACWVGRTITLRGTMYLYSKVHSTTATRAILSQLFSERNPAGCLAPSSADKNAVTDIPVASCWPLA